MDQRADDQHTPLNTAALNPAYVPGLMPSLGAAPEVATARQSAPGPEPDAQDAAADEPGTAASAADAATEARTEAEPETADETGAADPEEAQEGPTLLLSDRRGSITADRSGIRLRLDGEEAEFGWDELNAVEYATSRWTRRFTVTVHLARPRARWFRTDVQAPDRASLAQWPEQLEEVLNAYFEE
ncbi:hypothetical protein AB0G73_35935 [Streptomyces sp. NPDC020719]|uniref:hypothetical protein n=1 Tax=unclassified Streptomyces TaxID=2593676 RepID=UPI0033CF215F